MLDPRFKNMWLVNIYVGCENVANGVIEYDQKLLLLLLDVYKLLMFVRVREFQDFGSIVDCQNLFQSFDTNANFDKKLYSFQSYLVNAKVCKCALTWWCGKKKIPLCLY